MNAYLLDADDPAINELERDALQAPGMPRVVPAAIYAKHTQETRSVFGHLNALYGFPTLELVEWLHARIGQRRAIEIGAGNGALAAALHIPATDSFQQSDPAIAALYAANKQPTITYGANVEHMAALEAVAHYRPDVVIASWVTHLYDETRHEAGGNMWGVDEHALLATGVEYIHIGNDYVHRDKSIWTEPHERLRFPWLYSRAMNGSPNFIASWKARRS